MRCRSVLLAGILILIMLAASRGAALRSLPLGVHTLRPDDQTLQQVQALGATYVVQVFSWREIEPTQDEFRWEYTDWLMRAADYYHLQIIARLDEPPDWAAESPEGLSSPPKRVEDYAEFAAQVAGRYRGRIAGYIVWNEPNLAREWGNRQPDPRGYVQLLHAASAAIRSTDSHARILSAGLAPTNESTLYGMDDRDFLRGMYAAGVRGDFDILAAHPYGFGNPPDDPHGAHLGLNLARLQDLHDIMSSNGDAQLAVWITEFGYTLASPLQPELQVTEAQQAAFLSRAYSLVSERWGWVGLFSVWNLSQGYPSGDEQGSYSLLSVDGKPRLAFSALRDLEKASGTLPVPSLSGPTRDFPVLARDVIVHLGDSEYPAPWVPLLSDVNPSILWHGQLYLRDVDLNGNRLEESWSLTVELMQANDLTNEIRVNGSPVIPNTLPVQDFTARWVSSRFSVLRQSLHTGVNEISVTSGQTFPAFQAVGYTWDDFQMRGLVLHAP